MCKGLKTNFLGVELASPLVLPAGVMGMSYSGLKICVENGAGMVTSKSLTRQPRPGHEGPVMAEVQGGFLNCMGLCNPGIEEGLAEIDEFKKLSSTPLIVSIFATGRDEFTELTLAANNSSADFLELNLSCPNVFDEFGIPLAASREQVFEIVKAVKAVSRLPVIAKLSPNVLSITDIALAAETAGADALCLINTLGPGMLIDIYARKPVLYNRFGGMSGPCLKPIALKLIYQVYSSVEIPIIGMGGIQSGQDAVEMKMAGASLIGVGTAIYYHGLEIFSRINQEIRDYLEESGYQSWQAIPPLEKIRD